MTASSLATLAILMAGAWWMGAVLLSAVTGADIGRSLRLLIGPAFVAGRVIRVLGRGLLFCLTWLTRLLRHQPQATPENVQWMTPRQKRRVLARRFDGLRIDGRRRQKLATSFRNVVVYGATGSGKTESFYVPNLLAPPAGASLVVSDVKGTLWQLCAPALAAAGYRLHCVSFLGAEPAGDRFNPLQRCAGSPLRTLRLAEALCPEDGKKGDFWAKSAQALCALLCRGLEDQPEEVRHLLSLRKMVSGMAAAPDTLDELFLSAPDPELLREWLATKATSSNTLSGQVATLRTALSFLLEDHTARIVTGDTLPPSFSELRDRPTALFVQVPARLFSTHGKLVSVLYGQILDDLLSGSPDPAARPVVFLMDEFASMGSAIRDYPSICAVSREYRLSFVIGLQTPTQLDGLYGRDGKDVILQNHVSTLILGGGLTDAGALRELSEKLGTQRITDAAGHVTAHPLLSPAQIRALTVGNALYLTADHPAPARLKLKPYGAYRDLRARAALPAVPLPPIDTSAQPALVELSDPMPEDMTS